MAFTSFKEASKVNYGRQHSDGGKASFSNDEVQLGATQRIADALEKIAATNDSVHRQRDSFRDLYRDHREKAEKLERSITGYKGLVARQQKQIAQLKAELAKRRDE